MKTFTELNLDILKPAVHEALRAWHTVSGTDENLLGSLLIVQANRPEDTNDYTASMLRLAANKVLLEAIDELDKQDQRAAHILRLRFHENEKIMTVAYKLNLGEHTVSRLQRTAVTQLTQIILDWELALRESRTLEIEAFLPAPSYTQLFGVEDVQEELITQLLQPDGPWVLAIVGIGGIGKTSLAHAVTYQIICQFHFSEVIWLRTEAHSMHGRFHSPQHLYDNLITDLAKHLWPDIADTLTSRQRLVQVRQTLKSAPHLIVIDNLETETETIFLLEQLNDLANPSKFLLTSRTRPPSRTSVLTLSLEELSFKDAQALIYYHAQDIGITTIETASEADLQDIYDLTGGNPLALKLVVSLLDIWSLSHILADLSQAHHEQIEDLYKHIYWQTWQTISDHARALLQAMPLVSNDGANLTYLQTISGLSERELWLAVSELRTRSLLEIRGTIQEKRYGIHRLTESFLRTEIIHWPEDEDSQFAS